MRSWLLRLHRWTGLATVAFLSVAALTGSVLAFKQELEAWLHPRLFLAAPPAGRGAADFIDPLLLREQLAQRHPLARADHLSFARPGQAQMFYLMPRTDAATGRDHPLPADQVFVDPYTGRERGARRWGVLFADGAFHPENLVPFVWRLHEALALPHPWGKTFMGLVALAWTLDCLVGLWLTFPRARPFLSRWAPAWRIKRGAAWQRLHLDLHRAGALWLWLALLVFAWSSVMLNLRPAYQVPMALVFEFAPEPQRRLPAPRPDPALGWREAHASARQHLQQQATARGFTVLAEESLWYRPAAGAYLYRTRTSLDIRHGSGVTDLWIDGDSGRLLQLRIEGQGPSGHRVSDWLRVLHTGEVGGLGYRLFVAALGLTVLVLGVTGTVVWWVRRRARRHAAAQTGAKPIGRAR